MPEAVIVAACRTAIGTSCKGSLTDTPAIELAEAVITEVVQRSGLDLIDLIPNGQSRLPPRGHPVAGAYPARAKSLGVLNGALWR